MVRHIASLNAALPTTPRDGGFAMLAIGCLVGMALSAFAGGPIDRASLKRIHDPVIVSTSDLAHFSDRATESFRLFALRNSVLVPIPFQFDQRDADDEWVVTADGRRQKFSFDENDELVFMVKDAGDRAAPTTLPAGHDDGVEIQIHDPVDGASAWVYLLHFPSDAPPKASTTYVAFDLSTNTLRAASYRIQYAPGKASLITGMQIVDAAGQAGPNIIADTRISLEMVFALPIYGSWRSRLTERDFGGQVDGFSNGSVRATRRVRQTVDLGSFLPDVPGGTVYSHYYFSSFQTPSTFSIPSVALRALREIHYEGANEFELSSGSGDATYWDAANPRGIRLVPNGMREVNTTTDHQWWAVSGPSGSCLHTFSIPDTWIAAGVIRGTVLRRDPVETSGAEGGRLSVGYSLLGLERVPHAGRFPLDMMMFVLPEGYSAGIEQELLAVSQSPLRYRVYRLPPPS